ncbi:MAG TPA: Stp1/IreP family PP2C-type Ser/Thr phosphatase [Chthonomonadales bacterium]|nr:Stp1/IreP family PP2C-type Ser/Thr phosphatase [Chthonomonadales bacterium]
MTEQPDRSGLVAVDDDQEITARFSRDELVRGWRERESAVPRVTAQVRFGARTDLGRVRENNEDKFDFYEPDDPTLLATRGAVYAVADGMGGHAAGQIASEIALKLVIAGYFDSVADEPAEALEDAIAEANNRIHSVAMEAPGRSGMGTTLTAVALIEDRALVAHVGDSRAYLVRDGAIRQITRDHSWVAEQVRIGALTLEQAEQSPYRNVITRSIGAWPSVEPELLEETVAPGDRWVLCSDGLTTHVSDEEILLVAGGHAPCEACRQLVELANARGGRDNITVCVLEVRSLDLWSRGAAS